MESSESAERRYLNGFIRLTSALVAGAALLNFIFLLATAPADGGADESRGRSPAGVRALSGKQGVLALERMASLDVDCSQASGSTEHHISAKWLRIHGAFCGPLNEVKETTILNQTTGMNAIVFTINPSTYTSDYFSLENGPNRIWINRVLNSGESRLTELTVIRE